MVTFGQVESVWPVIGSVLVQDGVAYASAGRTTEADVESDDDSDDDTETGSDSSEK